MYMYIYMYLFPLYQYIYMHLFYYIYIYEDTHMCVEYDYLFILFFLYYCMKLNKFKSGARLGSEIETKLKDVIHKRIQT